MENLIIFFHTNSFSIQEKNLHVTGMIRFYMINWRSVDLGALVRDPIPKPYWIGVSSTVAILAQAILAQAIWFVLHAPARCVLSVAFSCHGLSCSRRLGSNGLAAIQARVPRA